MGTGAQSLTLLALLLPFLGAIVAPALTRVLKHNAAWVLALVPLWLFIHFAGFLETVAGGNSVAGGLDWVPSLGVRFSWYLDGLSLTFALLISGIGTLIVLYSGGYLKGHRAAGPLLLLHPDVHGRHAGPGPLRLLPDAVRLLGTDLDHLLPADRLRP